MNTAFWRLTWKEYRAIRLFWLSIVGLVFLLSWLFVLTQERATAINLVFNFALGAPAFFAIGCAGAAFAAEKEEGTFEFLRASPVSSGEILASKLLLTIAATLAMYAVLWPLALWATGSHLPEPTQLPGMLGVWLVGAIEAIAWGTFFSLLGARPLLAVVLAIAAASTCAHVLSWTTYENANHQFEWLSYLHAAPRRLVLALAVVGLDVYLGMRWLGGATLARKRANTAPVATGVVASDPDWVGRLLAKRSRAAILGRLLWQHWRQTWLLMLIMGGLYLGLPILLCFNKTGLELVNPINLLGSGGQSYDSAVIVPMAIMAALMGACVFLPDQERRNYRFFFEHNVPARSVWFTRQVCWIAILLVATSVICFVWVWRYGNFQSVWEALSRALRYGFINYDERPGYNFLYLPPLDVGLALAAVSFAAGQFASMLVRSGIMAGFFGLLLCGALCGWVLLMNTMEVSFLWSVWPIPLVLLFATWLRAPDWVSENKRWSARARVALAVLIPAAAILIRVPLYRVHEIPVVSPGFDVQQYKADLRSKIDAGLATADMYRQAWQLMDQQIDDRREFLAAMGKPLELVLEASKRPECYFADPVTAQEIPEFHGAGAVIGLVWISAAQLQEDGHLDEALDRYFDAIRAAGHLSDVTPSVRYFANTFDNLAQWGVQPGQTADRIRGAIERLKALSPDMLRGSHALKARFVLASRFLRGETQLRAAFNSEDHQLRSDIAKETLWSTLMPWENNRALRLLNIITQVGLNRLGLESMVLANQDSGLVFENAGSALAEFADDFWMNRWRDRYNDFAVIGDSTNPGGMTSRPILASELGNWMSTTSPNLFAFASFGARMGRELVEVEALKRGTMLVLAIEAYRLDHGELPKSLDDLRGAYLDHLPIDPFSGLQFRYFPEGVPMDDPSQELVQDWGSVVNGVRQQVELGKPCVWCTGPELSVQTYNPRYDSGTEGGPSQVLYYYLRGDYPQNYLPKRAIWSRGFWFPFADQQN
jgi:hypothetical protein